MSLCKFHQISFWFIFIYQELSLVLWPSAPSFFCKEVYTTTEPDTSIQEWATEGTCQWIIDGINLASLVLLWEIILKYQSWTIIPAFSQFGNIAVIKLDPILCTNHKVRSQKKERYYLGIFPTMGGGGLPKSQNFCKFTKYFFVCQIHSEVLKHVLQMGG